MHPEGIQYVLLIDSDGLVATPGLEIWWPFAKGVQFGHPEQRHPKGHHQLIPNGFDDGS